MKMKKKTGRFPQKVEKFNILVPKLKLGNEYYSLGKK
jgi:hypothetical protein